jgi:hypothetical protein
MVSALGLGPNQPFRPDDNCLVAFPALIPGATYRAKVPGRSFDLPRAEKEFTAVSGKTVQLGTSVMAHPE